MNKKDEIKIKEAFNDRFKEIFYKGLLQGAKAIAHVLLEKAKDTTKTPEQRVDDIVNFCNVSLQSKNESNDKKESGE